MRYPIILCVPIVLLFSMQRLQAESEYDNLRAEDKAIAAANTKLDRIYQQILGSLDGKIADGDAHANDLKRTLIAAERAWIKWRDAEALFRVYEGGSVGGSALNEDLHQNMLDLIGERRKFLEKCWKDLNIKSE